MGRKTRPKPLECEHSSVLLTTPSEEGYQARCLPCETLGPVREIPEEALQALRERLLE
jgi:hypothetical protein